MRLSLVPRSLQRHAPLLIASVLLLAMGISLAGQFTDWQRLWRAPLVSLNAAPPAVQDVPPATVLAALFGTSSTPVENPQAPVTRLRLSLQASFVHADPQRSSAIVQREGKLAQRYAIGAEIDEGIRLHAVYRERIELQRNGQLETLRFPSRNTNQASSVLDSPAPVPQDGAADDAALDPHEPAAENNAALLRERMGALRQQMEAAGNLPDTDSTD